MEKAEQVSSERGTGDQSGESNLWAGKGASEGFGPGEKIREFMPYWAGRERTVLK